MHEQIIKSFKISFYIKTIKNFVAWMTVVSSLSNLLVNLACSEQSKLESTNVDLENIIRLWQTLYCNVMQERGITSHAIFRYCKSFRLY